MDILENNVRSECKQAFAELQTDLTDLTMEIEASGIPIVSHKTYVMNVFLSVLSLLYIHDKISHVDQKYYRRKMIKLILYMLVRVFVLYRIRNENRNSAKTKKNTLIIICIISGCWW